MNTTTLTSVFLQSKEELKEALEGLKLPGDYAELQRVVNNHIENLLISDNEFRNSLNASDAEMLSHTLRMTIAFQKLSLTDSMDFKKMAIRTEYEIEQPINDKESDIIENAISLLPTVICAFINPWLAVAVGAGTIGFKKVYKRNGRMYAVNVKEVRKDISINIEDNEIQAIISGIESLCAQIDEIVSKIQRDRKDVVSKMQNRLDECTIEKMYPQIVTSLQYLFMENIKKDTKDPNVQNMQRSLQVYGYKIVEYSTATAGFFSKRINPNVSEETMYLPAIVKEIDDINTIVVEGIVYIPA